ATLTKVYPNPAQNMVTVSSSVSMTQLTVTNYVGQVVYTSKVNATSVELNTSSYQAGVYLVKIDTDNGVVTKRVIISR
ncbi:MAG: T9SS type A sorting domain-containing protein, partial [Bacteroidetes bacterium]|nr:T9SS type A sorting domain-containing protein [Bacteroidota bacterium]